MSQEKDAVHESLDQLSKVVEDEIMSMDRNSEYCRVDIKILAQIGLHISDICAWVNDLGKTSGFANLQYISNLFHN